MEYIKLTKDGQWIANKYDEEACLWNEIKINHLPRYINKKFIIEDGTTFATFINSIYPYAEEFNILTEYFLVDHLEYYKENPVSNSENPNLFDYLEIYHNVSVEYYEQSEKARLKRNKRAREMKINVLHPDGTSEEKNMLDGLSIDLDKLGDIKSELDISNSFDGFNIKTKTHYALDFSLISDLQHLPLKINYSYDLIWVDNDHPKHKIKKLIKGLIYEFSLKEVIETIFYELFFHGNPERVIEMKEMLNERKEEMEIAIKNQKKLNQQKNKLHDDLNKILKSDSK